MLESGEYRVYMSDEVVFRIRHTDHGVYMVFQTAER